MNRVGSFLVVCLVGAVCAVGATAEDPRKPTESQLRRAVELRSGALVYLEEGRFDLAAERLEELRTILPENVLPAVDLAIAYFGLGRNDDALREAERALALDPANGEALFAVAWSLRFEPSADGRWHEVIRRFAAAHPEDARPHYLEALHLRELHAGDADLAERRRDALLAAHDRDPDNLMLSLTLLESALAAGDEASASDALEAAATRLGGFENVSAQAASQAADLRQLLAEGAFAFDFGSEAASGESLDQARPRAAVLHNLLRSHDLYRLGSQRLSGGVGGETFAMQDFLPPLPASVQGHVDPAVTFVHLEPAQLGGVQLVPARRRGRDTLLLVGPRSQFEVGGFGDFRRMALPGFLPSAIGSWDLTGDGETDRVWVTSDGSRVEMVPGWLAESAAGAASDSASEATSGPARLTLFEFGQATPVDGLWPLDVDHDGDLDLFTGARYLRNDGSTWTDQTGTMGLVGVERGPATDSVSVTDAVSADFDDDGDLDVVLVRGGAPVYLENRRAGALVDATESSGLAAATTAARHVEMADFDGDGRFDLLFWSRAVSELWRSVEGGFQQVEVDLGPTWQAATHGDFDNDGDVDLVVQRQAGDIHVWLLRNRNGEFVAERLWIPDEVQGFHELRAADLDDDGDVDLVALDGHGRLHRWRNDGGGDDGSENHWLGLTLVGREHNNSKNNTQGLFARIEVRVGDRLLVVPGHGGVNRLGLGDRRRADVVRVVWPNGLSQVWQQVAADQSLVEEQVLKGSCPFLYTWDGDGFRFVTDLMWRSPLGMVMADGRAAPHQSARDAVLLPPGALHPIGDELWLSVTEELWEAAYVDQQRLVAIDHPPNVELVVDERILPPPYPTYPDELPLHFVEHVTPPSAATLHLPDAPRDVLAELAVRDEVYVGDLALTRYQGLTVGQSLELEWSGIPPSPPLPRGESRQDVGSSLVLLLWGWTFPTDTSINVALAADPALDPFGPSLEVWKGGTWHEVSPFVGFPAGKRKGMVVELPPELSAHRPLKLRLSTNLQIYWDAVALAFEPAASAFAATHLVPRSADLHPRGVSKLVRSSPDSPHLFDYDTVRADSPFRPMAGAFTRFGDVVELLHAADDRYAVMAAGDEMTVVYDAVGLPPLPDRWVRRWVLFTDGWVKDADINTTESQSVEPLPYAAMGGYPDPDGHAVPDTPAHRDFLRRYQTRTMENPRW